MCVETPFFLFRAIPKRRVGSRGKYIEVVDKPFTHKINIKTTHLSLDVRISLFYYDPKERSPKGIRGGERATLTMLETMS